MAYKQWLPIFVLSGFIFLVYSNTYSVPFIFDDERNIDVFNLRMDTLSLESVQKAAFSGTIKTRPVSNVSFALNNYFHQDNLKAYHLTNIAVHAITAIFLFLFLQTTLSLEIVQKRYGPPGLIPLVVTLAWCVHPLQVQSVTYLVQRMNSMAALFFFLSLLTYVRGRLSRSIVKKWLFFSLSLLAALFSFGSKENSYSLPFIILLYEFFFLQDLDFSWIKKHGYLIGLLLFFLIVTVFFFLGSNPVASLEKGFSLRPFSFTERMLTEGRVVFFYLSQIAFPHPSRLNLLHDFSLSTSLFNPPSTFFAYLGILLSLGSALLLAQKDRLISFCILCFFVTIAIESSIIPLEIIYEHRSYLPSTMVILLAVVLGHRYIPFPKIKLGIAVFCILLFSFWTYERNKDWHDGLTFWQDALAKSPNLPRVHNNYGYHLYLNGRVEEAVSHFKKSLELDPPGKVAGRSYYNLGVVLAMQKQYDTAIRYYLEALRLHPTNSQTHNNLGDMYERKRNLNRAEYHFEQAAKLDPYDPIAQYNLGLIAGKKRDYTKAVFHFSEALRLDPGYSDALKSLRIAQSLLNKKNPVR